MGLPMMVLCSMYDHCRVLAKFREVRACSGYPTSCAGSMILSRCNMDGRLSWLTSGF